MSGVFRVGFCKLSNKIFSANGNDIKMLRRGIKGSVLRCITPQPQKPAPWPYQTKGYNKIQSLFDKTTSRMDENSKLIVVEGSVAAGKTKFARELAQDLGMYHLPEANLDMWFTNEYGFNFKKCDEQLPEDVRSFDIKDFFHNPKHRHVAKFQLMQYVVKFSQYIDALAHLLSTGQGVVLERCVYSDFVFVEAMSIPGYLSKGARSVYYEVRKNSLFELLRPHLVIYLDVHVDKILQKIKKRNIPCEVQSRILNPSYLQTLEDKYKQGFLKEISTHSELLVYDWSEEGDMDVIIEDIERLDFKRMDKHDPKLSDWVFELEEDWAIARAKYADQKDDIMEVFNIPRFDVPELVASAEDCKEYYDIYYNSPGNTYLHGYNPLMGDGNILFKLGVPHRNTLPVIERDLR